MYLFSMFDAPYQDSELVKDALSGQFQLIADMSLSDVRHYPEQQRLRAVKRISESVLKRSPAPKDDLGKPVCEEAFATEIAALIRISETMRHTPAYTRWLDVCRELLVYKLSNNSKYMRFTKKWDKRDVSLRKGAHNVRERLHTQSANKTFKPIFKQTRIDWFSRPKREDPDPERRVVTNGLSLGDITTGKSSIQINTHADSTFTGAASSNSTGHHEKVHDLGFQLGHYYARGEFEVLGEQCEDGMLWYYLKKERANISPRIMSAYRAQFHEVVAFDEGSKMATAVTRILQESYRAELAKLII